MTELSAITGQAAALRYENLDTDQIMPKQFLRGIDKSGLARGVLYDQRFDAKGEPRADFVLNRPEYAQARILIGGANFGCGSSREHAVWGLQQFGISAVIAPSFGEIFYSNAMNNRLLVVMLPRPVVERLMDMADADPGNGVTIDLQRRLVQTTLGDHSFTLSTRHQQMFLQGLDVIGLSLQQRPRIEAFIQDYGQRFPWNREVARKTFQRLDKG